MSGQEIKPAGLPQKIPVAVDGAEHMAPGEWCKFALQRPCNFPVSCNGHRFRGYLLLNLTCLPGVREPLIRPDTIWAKWSALEFYSKVNNQRYNVEALAMQCVGRRITKIEDSCFCCQKGNGPFQSCVTVDGVAECANCHWSGRWKRCSFTFNRPTMNRRRTLIQRRTDEPYTEDEIKQEEKELDNSRKLLDTQMDQLREIIQSVKRQTEVALCCYGPEYSESMPLEGCLPLTEAAFSRWLAGPWLQTIDRDLQEAVEKFESLAEKSKEIFEREKMLCVLRSL
ncbi:hypothetical protein N7454_005403 [Penicillium verhagenii]|nr:hypothetical protein N7454_005403 [Penicillium verhagenii]